jgi:allantoinase
MADPLSDFAITGVLRYPDGSWRPGEVVASDGVITHVGEPTGQPIRRIDVGRARLLPGIIDSHVHCLSSPAEGITAATRAAAAGGVTTIVEMPFDKAGPINSVERLHAKQAMAAEQAVVDVALLATLAPHGGWSAASDLAKEGACGFKVSLFNTDPHRFPRIDDAELIDVFAAIADTGRTVCVHAENDEIVHALIRRMRDAGETSPPAHARSRPPISETQGVLSVLETAWYTGARAHLCHLSVPRSVDLVRRWALDGADVSLETCPHYLVFTEDDVAAQGGRLKINPPVRSAEAQAGLWDRLCSGEIDIVGSDHAPWPLADKSHANMFDNHSGVPGVETMVPFVLGAALARSEKDFDAALKAMTSAPAARFGLAARKGALAEGMDADVTVFDPAQPWKVDESRLHSNAGWSPYHGRTSSGRIALTVVRGNVVYDGAAVVGEPGYGAVVAP